MSLFGGSGGALQNQKRTIQRSRDQAVNNVQQGSQTLQSYLGDKARQEIIDAQGSARNDIQAYSDQARPYLEQAVAGWSPLEDKYGALAQNFLDLAPGDLAARTMYSNSLGLNGDTGNEAAVNAFHVSPGYQFQVDEANKNILRNGAATGNVLSGNVGIALNDRARQLANQEYGGWQSRLSDLGNNIYKDYGGAGTAYGGMGNATQGKAAALTNLGNLFTNEGSSLGDISMTGGAQRAGLYGKLGEGINNNYNTIANIDWNRGASLSAAQQANQAQQAAQQQALWGGLLGFAGNVAGAAGKAGSFGTLFG